jgi:hypothetical protein
MTHASARLEANYNALTSEAQNRFDELMAAADTARNNSEYIPLMTALAAIAGLPTGEIRKCGCSCYCPVIFDADRYGHVIEESKGYNLGRHQCPWCADQHRETA